MAHKGRHPQEERSVGEHPLVEREVGGVALDELGEGAIAQVAPTAEEVAESKGDIGRVPVVGAVVDVENPVQPIRYRPSNDRTCAV